MYVRQAGTRFFVHWIEDWHFTARLKVEWDSALGWVFTEIKPYSAEEIDHATEVKRLATTGTHDEKGRTEPPAAISQV
jgi:hypothetical protein